MSLHRKGERCARPPLYYINNRTTSSTSSIIGSQVTGEMGSVPFCGTLIPVDLSSAIIPHGQK